ncbi:MAG: ABC transporter substrate-binding protein [SAR324 cluster bacterium]|nr:ABC transporter substrate-binding protein [SAR324 cluster bacterium]
MRFFVLLGLIAFASPAFADEICPKRGGILKTVDMHYKKVDPTQRENPFYFMPLVYDSLLDTNADLSLSPGLAEAMPTQVDKLTYVFKLRKGIKFHDGTDFDAESVVYNVERLKAGKVISALTGTWKRFVKRVSATDSHTVKFELNEEWPSFLWGVASSLRIGSPTLMEKLGMDYGLKEAAGTGPFMLDSFKPKKTIKLVRNPNYYRKGEPCLDGFQAQTIKSGKVRILSLKKGDLDVINTFPESQFPQLKGDNNIIVDEGKASTLTLLPMNTRHPALKDKRVRQAIQYAVNGKELIDNVYRGAGVEVESIFPPWHPAFMKAADLSPIRQNIEKAKDLLKQAGYGPGGKVLKLSLETGSGGAHVQRGVLIQAQLKAVGIELEVKNISAGQMFSNMRSGKYQLALWQMLGGPTMKDYTWNLYSGDGGNNVAFYNKEGGYQNPKVNALTNAIVATEDAMAVQDKIKELQEIVFEDVPYIFLNFRNHRTARRSYVKNFQTGKLKGREDIRRVWIDK